MKTFIKNLCDKLDDWGIDPITLAKTIGIYLITILSVSLMVIFPILLKIVAIIIICIGLVGLIYLMIE